MFTSALRSDKAKSSEVASGLRQDFASMNDGASATAGHFSADLPASVRVDARLKLGVERFGAETRLAQRHESGAFRFRFPRAHGRPPEAVTVNIAGGLAGGDRVLAELRVGEGASLAFTSAAAERIYRSAGDTTRLSSRLILETGARALWLPQETILHNGARVERRFEIDIAVDARLLFGEILYFGRRASGEGYDAGMMRESWRVRHAGRLALADETRLDGLALALGADKAALGHHVAMATLLFAHPDAGEALEPVRAVLDAEETLESGATDLGPLVLVRLLSADAARLRGLVLELAALLAARIGMPMPRALLN